MTLRNPFAEAAPQPDLARLQELIEGAVLAGCEADVRRFIQHGRELTIHGMTSSDPPLDALDLNTLAAQSPQPAEWAIEGAAPLGELVLFNGAPGVGKTLFSTTAAVAIAAGLGAVLGLQTIAGPVIYYACEEPVRHLHWMLHHACRKLSVDMAALAGRLHILNRRGELENHFGTFDHDGTFTPSATWRRLIRTAEMTRAKVIFVDNAAHVFVGGENDRGEVTRAMAVIAAEAERLGCCIVLLAHPNKGGSDYSGSTAWIASVRSQFVIERPEDADDDDVRLLRSGKSNYSGTGELARFRWHDHAFVLDTDLPSSVAAEVRQVARTSSANEAFLRCLAKVTDEGRNVSHTGASNYAPRVFARMPLGKGYSVEDFAAAMERLLHNGTILAGQRVGQYDNRSPKLGLQLAGEAAHNPAQSPAQSAHKEAPKACTNAAQSPHNRARSTYPPPTGEDGGAPMGWPTTIPDDLDWGSEEAQP